MPTSATTPHAPTQVPRRAGGCSPATLSLPVLGIAAPTPKTHADHAPNVKRSRASRWRAGLLIAVQAAMATHLLLWLRSGLTLSPVEPSESMYTLETGEVNAGFVFFILAIVSTFLFGRFFCGWACHIVALQDACNWFMCKVGVRPKPFRSRLLVWVPVALAFYMFAWPTIRREVLWPILRFLSREAGAWIIREKFHASAAADALRHTDISLPFWFGQAGPFPGFRNGLIVEDFWATFPPWYVALPFFAVCGFAAVYFLGSKGFCTYGCPYGGIFGPVDRVSIGRIVVSDACNGCGHCTATCTSNVRVHQEVRDYGMVMDAGCMKCMDCVSVCPNGALSFKFAKPSALTKPRVPVSAKAPRPAYDLSWAGEYAVFGVWLVLFWSFRGMFNKVPMLMAVGIAGIGAFCAWKLWSLARVPNVRLQNLQLRSRGKLMLAGFLFVPCAIALLAAGAWSGAVRGLRWYGDRIDERIEASESTVFAPGYSPDPRDKALALRAIHAMELAGPRNSLGETNGMGWSHTPDGTMRLAWLWAVAGNLDHAQAYLSRALHAGKPGEEALQDMSKVLALRTKPPAAWTELLESVTIAQPHAYHARVALGYAEARAGNTDGALAHFRAPFEHVHKATEQELQRGAQGVFSLLGALPPDRAEALAQETLASLEAALPMKPHAADLRVFTATVAVQLDGETLSDATKRKARASLDEAVSFKPRDPSLRLQRAVFLLLVGEAPAAVADLREAVRHQPRNTTIHVQAGDVLAQAGKFAEAAGYYERADALQPGTAAIVERFAQALDQAGDGARAAKIRRGER